MRLFVLNLSRLLFAIGLPIVMSAALSAYAGDDGVEGAEGIWVPVTLEVHSKDPDNRLYGIFGVESRLTNSFVKEFDEILIQPGLGYKLTDNINLEAGYVWLGDTNRRFAVDQRLWQGITIKKDLGKLDLNVRNRIEQRWLPGADSLHVRNRTLVGARYQLGDSPWYLSSQNEIFVNLADAGVRAEGIDQYRIFAGVGRRFGKQASVEGGYQLQHSFRREPPDRLNHIILIRASYRIN